MAYIRSSEGSDYIMHHGVPRQQWHHRRYQDKSGRLTELGYYHRFGHARPDRGTAPGQADNAASTTTGDRNSPDRVSSRPGGIAFRNDSKDKAPKAGAKKAADFVKEKTAQAKAELDKLREERLKKNKEKWSKDPNLLWENRDKFTKEEIDAAMEKFRSEKALEDFNSARKKEQEQKDRDAKLQAEKDEREARIQAEKDKASQLEREKKNKQQEEDRKAQKEREKEEYERYKRNAAADDIAATVARTANMAANLFNIANTFSTATTGRTIQELAWQRYNRSLEQKMKDVNTAAVEKETIKIFTDEGGKYDKKTGTWVDNSKDRMASTAAAAFYNAQTNKFDKATGYKETRKPYSSPNQKTFDAQWPPWMTGGKGGKGGNNGGGKGGKN